MTRFLGRSDDIIKIRGTNVSPESGAESLVAYMGRITDWILVATREYKGDVYTDHLTAKIETREPTSDLASELRTKLSQDLGLSVAVELLEPGALASDTRSDTEGERKVRRIMDMRGK
jgi:phenylacetate-CoA ligase